MRKTMIAVAAALLLVAPLAHAGRYDRENWERLLLPIHPLRARAGAFGALWQTELTVFNAGAEPVEIFQRRCGQDCSCAITTLCIPEPSVPPGGFFEGFSAAEDISTPANPAAFLYVQKSQADDVAAMLRLYDAANPKLSFGVQIPVVRERDIRTGKIVLLNVPMDAAYRQQLRVFGVSSPSGGGDVRVRIYAERETTPLVDTMLRITPSENRTSLPADGEFPRFPGYAEIVSLAAVLPSAVPDRVRVEIDPLTPGLRYWAFISVTSNETNEVTLIAPQ